MISMLVFAFKIVRPIIFPPVHKVNFPQLRYFITVKKSFHSQQQFPQLRKFFIIKEIFYS